MRRLAVVRRWAAGPLLLLLLTACGSSSTTPTGSATPSPSPGTALNMTLLSQMDLTTMAQAPPAAGADRTEDGATGGESAAAPMALSGAGNWGYTSPGGRRFALTGTSAGLSVVEVSDPSRPRAVALVPGAESLWREVRTYGTYAYVTTEARAGLDIVDLRDPDRPRKVQSQTRSFQSAHTLWIDADRGLLFANGTNGRTGGLRILDVRANPEDPPEVGSFTGYYIHDSYSRGNVLYASAINDGFEGLLDVGDPSRVREITRFFTGGRFTHNSWLSRDGRYLFTTDERTGRPVEGWDLIDPLSPRKVSEYIASSTSIAHNVLVDGDRLLVAHYTEGVHLLDVRNPEQPRLLGYYDSQPPEITGFHGVWGAYLFPGTNVIVASDIERGLLVVNYTGR
jgi:choice-of-anchor B domain-containing protein